MAHIEQSKVKFTNKAAREPVAVRAIIEYARTDFEEGQVNEALVKCTPKAVGGRSWHYAGSDIWEPVHISVVFSLNGQHVSSRHIYWPEDEPSQPPVPPRPAPAPAMAGWPQPGYLPVYQSTSLAQVPAAACANLQSVAWGYLLPGGYVYCPNYGGIQALCQYQVSA